MKDLLLAALASLVSATEEPLPLSGNFTTIYLAPKLVSVTEENSEYRMLMREVKYFKNYTLMSMTFYIRKNGKCQLHTVWADKAPYKFCFKRFTASVNGVSCTKKDDAGFIIGTWVLRDANRHFTKIYYKPAPEGGRKRSKGTNITEKMWKKYVNLKSFYDIPIGNIQNIYEADDCPKWER